MEAERRYPVPPTSQVPENPAPRITAVAKDLPGDSEGLVWQNN